MSAAPEGPLAGLRVLEIADEKGRFCGKLLGDMGADVIKIEPPGGDHTRRVGPFLDDIPHRDRSLSFWYYNTSKRGITLALDTPDGRDLFRQLAAGADVVVESLSPGVMTDWGLDYAALAADNPGLVYCSITPFGRTGPWAGYRSADLIHMAGGGEMASCGYDEAEAPDAPPIAPGGGNAWHMGSHYAYIAIMAALLARQAGGVGQDIDVSIHESCALTTESAIANWVYRGEVLRRQTGRHHAPAPTPRTQFLARDGKYVTALISGGLNARNLKALAELMDAFGYGHDLHDGKYADPAVIAAEAPGIINRVLADFIASVDSETIYHAAQDRGFTWGAVRSADELLGDPHLDDRGFWKTVAHPELGREFVYPGEAALFSDSPWRISRRAPLVGEHNEEVFCGALGLSRLRLVALMEAGVL
jgi:crotonobetainyl-CoA:carnitine CoA-transferase CaiB-like acyl-CoA transferase